MFSKGAIIVSHLGWEGGGRDEAIRLIRLCHNKIYLIPPIILSHGEGGGGKGIWFYHDRIYLIPPYSSVIFLYTVFQLAADWQSIFYSPPLVFTLSVTTDTTVPPLKTM